MWTRVSEPWDAPVRGRRYSIVTKREHLQAFLDDPDEASLKRLAGSLWSFQLWQSMDFPVQERLLGRGHSPAEFGDFLEAAADGEASTSDEDSPTLSPRVLSELLEAMDPETFATLNADARDGLAALGYAAPGIGWDDDGEYWTFVEDTKAVVEQYGLRDRLVEGPLEAIPDDVPAVDVAQVAFQLHADDEAAFDLEALADEG